MWVLTVENSHWAQAVEISESLTEYPGLYSHFEFPDNVSIMKKEPFKILSRTEWYWITQKNFSQHFLFRKAMISILYVLNMH